MHKKIPNFENYSVNEYGEVFSTRGLPLCQWKDNIGYKQVVLYKNNKRYYKRVHRLVYQSFFGTIPEGLIINHIDNNKDNNSLSNLELLTISENTKHFHDYNKQKSYEISVYVKETGEFLKRFDSLRQLCKELNLNRKTVTSIVNGEKKTNNYKYNFVNHTK